MADRLDSPVTEAPTVPPRRRRVALLVAVLGLGVAAGAAAAVYGLGAFQRNPEAAACPAAVAVAKRIAPLARGEVAAVVAADDPQPLAAFGFTDGAGAARTLADWKGRTVLLNLWATWCVPCRKEMPALAALQRALGGPDFEVVAVNVDTRDPAKPKKWLAEVGIDGLGYYADPTGTAMRSLKVFGLPATWVIDPSGCAVATIAGPAEWASPDALALLEAALGK